MLIFALHMKKARLVFEDGTVFNGTTFASGGECFGEVVFNTAMSGYQEILTDPSYCDQMVVMCYPIIGSYGINEEDMESKKIYLKAMIVREYMDYPSNWRSTKTLKQYLEEYNVLGVENIDTRALTRYLRKHGAKRAILTTSDLPLETLVEKVKSAPHMVGQELASQVACKEPYLLDSKLQKRFRVAVIDCGIKSNILRLLASYGCECHVLPPSVKAEDVLRGDYDGLFISNGPGDPEPVTSVIELLRNCLGKLPIFGICLGQQLMGIAFGGKTYKLAFGHHGANHPVKNLKTGRVEITSQNHGFNVDMSTLDPEEVEVTHINLNDNTVSGIRHKKYPAFSVQYHPEAAPGPHDSSYLFEDFVTMMETFKK